MTTRAVVYARLSAAGNDPDNIPNQVAKGQAYADEHGYQVVGVFKDDEASAFKSVVVREQYDEMIDLVMGGGVEVIVVRHSDRLTRNLETYGRLVNWVLRTRRPLRVEFYAGGGYDLSTAAGRLQGGLQTVLGSNESDTKSERVREAVDRNRRKGKRTGGGYRWFGYISVYRDPDETDPRLRRKLREDLHPEESTLIRQTVARLLDPHAVPPSLRQVAADWNATGLMRPASGKPWTGSDVRRVLASPHIAGIVRWKGNEYGAAWPAIITKEMHVQLVEWLDNPSRRRLAEPPSGERKHLLVGLLWCGSCGGRMVCWLPVDPAKERAGQIANPGERGGKGRGRTYLCRPHHRKDDPSYRPCDNRVRIDAETLEEYVSRGVQSLWVSPKARKAALAVDDRAQQLVALAAEVRALNEDLTDLLRHRRARIAEYGEEAYAAVVKEAKQAQERTEREYDKLNTAQGQRSLPDPSIGWDRLTYDEKRELIKLLVPGGITILPHPRVLDPETGTWRYPIAMRPFADDAKEMQRKAELMQKRVRFEFV